MLQKLERFAHSTFYNVVVGAAFILFNVLGYLFLGGRGFVEEWGGAVAAAIGIAALIWKTQGYWVWSIINAILWLILFSASLKLLAGLQVSYIIFSLYGIWQWASVKFRIGYNPNVWTDNLGTIISLAIFGYVLYAYHNMPGYTFTILWWVEFFGVFISIISNWMDAFKYKGNWIGWTMTNLLFGPLFYYDKLWAPFAMTFVYQALCFVGYYNWFKEEKRLVAEGRVELVGAAEIL